MDILKIAAGRLIGLLIPDIIEEDGVIGVVQALGEGDPF
jgi:hypothetical protein